MKKIEEIAMEYALPQSKYKLATERYEAVAKLLIYNGIDCKIYPQGSFSYGAITRPYKDGKDVNFDLDLIVEFPNSDEIYPMDIMKQIAKILESSPIYKGNYKMHENGFIINYSNDFSMDIIPAKEEDLKTKELIRTHSLQPLYANYSIKLPKFNSQRYSFIKNNPKGFKKWFDSINMNSVNKDYVSNYKRQLFNESLSNSFYTVDEIPDDYVVTPLQKVIILLKRNRDVYYSRRKVGTKPLSGMLCLLACKAVENKPYLSFDETLVTVLDYIIGLENNNNEESLHLEKGKWILENPTNCYDNLADNWENSTSDGKEFFLFIRKVRKDLVSRTNNESLDESVVYNSFGKQIESYKEVSNTGKSWKK